MKTSKLLMTMAVAAMLVSCGGAGGGMPNFGNNEYPVETISLSNADLKSTYPANIKGIQDVQIRPKVSGFLTKVCVKEGQNVSAGQLLFVIDNETYQAAVRQAKAAVNTATAQLNTAKLTYENNKTLFEKNVIGQYELSTAANQYETAQASLAQAKANLASAEETLSYCYVKSPAAGVVGTLPYKVGALVSGSSAEPLTTVSNISTMEVYFSMTEKEVLNMTKVAGNAQAAIAAMPAVQLQLADGTVYNHQGKVVKMSGVIDATTGSVQLIAHFSNPEHLLKSGGSGSIILPKEGGNSIVIPQSATTEVQNKVFVYVVGKDNKVKYTEIQINPQNDGTNYVVTSGLKAGDRLVVNGLSSLSDGMEIKLITPEQYQKNLEEAEKLSSQQSTAKGFTDALKK